MILQFRGELEHIYEHSPVVLELVLTCEHVFCCCGVLVCHHMLSQTGNLCIPHCVCVCLCVCVCTCVRVRMCVVCVKVPHE